MTPLSNKPAKDGHPKTLGRWSYYTHFRDNGVPLPPTSSFITQQFTPPPLPSPPAQRPQKRHPKLGINHMDLLYKTEKEVMVCRICLANTKKFPLNASWADLINHCQTEHSKACEDMEKLSPSQIAEMKQRMPPVASTR
ncbi:hypothetical protein BYT27DRAFT_7086727 [Phlegmacium glaucopus]|nr:hypothetical protein BYT27DRAFT_7086727 [Phlegmacium glaucopus]